MILLNSECKSKNVLDIGCAGLSVGVWLHEGIAGVVNRCVGVDIDAEGVEKLKKRGCDIHLADAENFDLSEKFEVAVLGELIEHLSNPGKVLDNVRGHLKSRGRMVVTTTDPYNLSIFIRYEVRDSGDPAHVAYYTPKIFGRLAEKYGFKEKKVFWIQEDLSERNI